MSSSALDVERETSTQGARASLMGFITLTELLRTFELLDAEMTQSRSRGAGSEKEAVK